MDNTRRKIITSLPVLALGAPFIRAHADTGQGPIRIGMTVSSSGSFALASQSGLRGVEVWVKEVNDHGGLNFGSGRRKIELVKRDDRSDKQMVARVYESLIGEDKVDLLFAPFGSTLTAVAATAAERMGKFIMNWSAASDELFKQGFKNLVSVQMPVATMLDNPKALAEQVGVKDVAIVYSDEPFPAGLARSWVESAKRPGSSSVALNERYPKGQKDFSTLLLKAQKSGAQGLILICYEDDMISVTRQLKQLDINFPYTFMVYAATPQFQATVGADADYLYGHTNFLPTINWDVNAGMNRAQFVKAYEATFAAAEFPADFQTALTYSAGAITAKIIETAASLQASELKAAALALSGKLVVLAGDYRIDETGNQQGMRFPVVQIQPGKGMVPVYPAEVATAEPIYPAPDWSKRA